MVVTSKDLWSLVKYRPYVDAAQLAAAIQDQVARQDLDFRSRLLIRDSLNALHQHWGSRRLEDWLAHSPVRDLLESIWREDLGEPGFFLEERIVTRTDPEDIRRMLRALGDPLDRPVCMIVGGSAALILPGLLTRATDDIDVVDEVPEPIRTNYPLLKELKDRYGLQIAHFQSRYLPTGWEKRLCSLEPMGKLQVYLVDGYDVVVSKLFSRREKDKNDLQMLISQLDKEILVRRLRDGTASLRQEEQLRKAAEHNWYILFGEPLPS